MSGWRRQHIKSLRGHDSIRKEASLRKSSWIISNASFFLPISTHPRTAFFFIWSECDWEKNQHKVVNGENVGSSWKIAMNFMCSSVGRDWNGEVRSLNSSISLLNSSKSNALVLVDFSSPFLFSFSCFQNNFSSFSRHYFHT